MTRPRTHYDVLGLKPTASDHKSEPPSPRPLSLISSVDKAYISYASVWHPTKCADPNANMIYSRISSELLCVVMWRVY